MYCKECGKEIRDKAVVCIHCGCAVDPLYPFEFMGGRNRGLIVFLLCLSLGALGIHRFYVGKTWTGLLMLLTFGGFGIWYIVDLVFIALGEFKDSNGNKIRI